MSGEPWCEIGQTEYREGHCFHMWGAKRSANAKDVAGIDQRAQPTYQDKQRSSAKAMQYFVPLLRLALKASSSFAYTQALRREHTPNSNFLGSLLLQAWEADVNLGSLGGPMVRLRARVGGIRSEDATTERREKNRDRWRVTLI